MNCPPLLALTDRIRWADTHWRIVRPWHHLRAAGVQADICWLDPAEMPTISPAGRVVVLQRVAVKGGTQQETAAWVQRLRDAGALAVVAELDDDIISPSYLHNIDAAGGLELVTRARLEAERQALEWALRASDGVTVSTEPLAEVVRRFTDKPVIVVPNAIDVDWFRERLAPRAPWADHLTIGWAGGRRDEADLEPMAIAWGRIARRYPDVRFVVAGWQPECVYREIEDLDQIIRLGWADLDDWPAHMQVDIGCCAVADTPFSRCKSPIKSWEYALAGAAVVATSTLYVQPPRETDEMEAHVDLNGKRWTAPRLDYGGIFSDPSRGYVIHSGSVGPFSEADQWEMKLAYAIEDQRERWRRAWAWRQEVERYHSLTANLHRWADAYSLIAASVRVSA